jgi:hypothetical protein
VVHLPQWFEGGPITSALAQYSAILCRVSAEDIRYVLTRQPLQSPASEAMEINCCC